MAVSRPTVEDLVGWRKTNPNPSNETLAVLQTALDAAIAFIEARVDLPEGTTDGNYPEQLQMAELIMASRYAKRSSSPEGTAGFGNDGAVVRIMSLDPDVEALILRFKKVDGFF